jgi:4-amino-4-deoxy-L-arabinose transferase-like glycosyltransferase
MAAGVLLAAGAGVALAATLRVRGRLMFALAGAVMSASSLIALLTALSLAYWLTPTGILVGQALAMGGAAAAWRLSGQWRPPQPRLSGRTVLRAARAHRAVAMLTVAAAIALVLQLIIGIAVAPNEPDTLLYHLPRAAYFLQNHSALQFQPIVSGDPTTGHPPNSELFDAWTMALTHGDRLVALPQWIALVGLAGAVFAGSRLLGATPAGALLAAGLFITLPEPLLEATTAQNDMLVTFFIAAAALFAGRGLRDATRGDLAIAGAAVGLAVGTKTSALLALPSLVLVLVAASIGARPSRSVLTRGAVYVLAGVAALGAPNYIQNLVNTANITGGTNRSVARDYTRSDALTNIARVSWWSFIETPGLPRIGFLERALGHPERALFDHIHNPCYGPPAEAVKTEIDEDGNAFGLVGLFLFAPLIVSALLRRRAPPISRALAAAAMVYLLLIAIVIGWSPDIGRQLFAGAILAVPLLAQLERRPWQRRFAVVLAIASTVPVLVLNPSKPLLKQHESSILSRDRRSQQLISFDNETTVLARLDRVVRPSAPLGYVLTRDFTMSDWPIYPIFGPGLARRVVPIAPNELTYARIRQLHLAGVLVWPAKCHEAGCQVNLSGLHKVNLGRGVTLVPARPSTPLGSGTAGPLSQGPP